MLEEHRKERHDYRQLLLRDKLRGEMIEAYGGCCKVCKISDPIVLVLDHIESDAYVELRKYGAGARGGYKLYLRLKKEGWPKDRFQLLCHNCNAKKEFRIRRMLAEQNYRFKGMTLEEVRVKNWSSNTSGFRGVHWNAEIDKWRARISIDGKAVWLGSFDDIRDAARAYKKAALAKWGEGAKVPTDEEIDNFVVEPRPKTGRPKADFSTLFEC